MSQQYSTVLSVWFQPLARCVGPSGFESSTSGSIKTISEEISAFAFFWKSVCHPLLIKDKNMYQRELKKTRNCLKPDKSSISTMVQSSCVLLGNQRNITARLRLYCLTSPSVQSKSLNDWPTDKLLLWLCPRLIYYTCSRQRS